MHGLMKVTCNYILYSHHHSFIGRITARQLIDHVETRTCVNFCFRDTELMLAVVGDTNVGKSCLVQRFVVSLQ